MHDFVCFWQLDLRKVTAGLRRKPCDQSHPRNDRKPEQDGKLSSDIDLARIREARENAVKAGVAEKVKFLQQDLFETDIHEATVVTLFLLPEVNLRLRPKLLSDLKPGTRVVSHNFGMGDWTQTPVRKNGLLLGSTAPEFELPDLSGIAGGSRTSAVGPCCRFSLAPHCGFCTEIVKHR